MQNKNSFKMRRVASSYNRLSNKFNNITNNTNNNDDEQVRDVIIQKRNLFNNIQEYCLKSKSQQTIKKMYDELWSKNENKKNNNTLSEAIKIENNKKILKNKISSANGTKIVRRRVSSTSSYCNLDYCSKTKIKTLLSTTNFSKSININNLSKNKSALNIRKELNDNFNSVDNKNDKKNFEISLINYCNSDRVKLRSDYLIKFSKICEFYKKMEQITDSFRASLREKYSETLKVLIKYFDICNNYLLNDLKENDGINTDIYSAVILYVYNFCLQSAKLQKFFYDEIHFMRKENLSLKQKFTSQEVKLNSKSKEINEINKYIVKYDLANKIKFGKQRELKIEKIKSNFENKESFYVMTIFKLKEEIKNLNTILTKYKDGESNFSNLKQKYKNLNEEIQNENNMLIKSYNQKNHDWKLLIYRINTLNDKLNDVEIENSKYKKKEMDIENNRIKLEEIIKNLNNIIDEKNKEVENLKKQNDVFKNILEEKGKLPPPAKTIFNPY